MVGVAVRVCHTHPALLISPASDIWACVQDDGTYWCERCSKSADPNWRYLINMTVRDFTDTLQYFAAFGESADVIMDNMKASTVAEQQACFWVQLAIVLWLTIVDLTVLGW